MGAELFHVDRRTDGRTDMAKVIIAFRIVANSPKNLVIGKIFEPTTKQLFRILKNISQEFDEKCKHYFFFAMAQQPPVGQGLLIIEYSWSQSDTTLGRAPLDEWSARRRDLYLTTYNTHKRQTSMPPAGFETTIPASGRLQTHALDRAVTGIGNR